MKSNLMTSSNRSRNGTKQKVSSLPYSYRIFEVLGITQHHDKNIRIFDSLPESNLYLLHYYNKPVLNQVKHIKGIIVYHDITIEHGLTKILCQSLPHSEEIIWDSQEFISRSKIANFLNINNTSLPSSINKEKEKWALLPFFSFTPVTSISLLNLPNKYTYGLYLDSDPQNLEERSKHLEESVSLNDYSKIKLAQSKLIGDYQTFDFSSEGNVIKHLNLNKEGNTIQPDLDYYCDFSKVNCNNIYIIIEDFPDKPNNDCNLYNPSTKTFLKDYDYKFKICGFHKIKGETKTFEQIITISPLNSTFKQSDNSSNKEISFKPTNEIVYKQNQEILSQPLLKEGERNYSRGIKSHEDRFSSLSKEKTQSISLGEERINMKIFSIPEGSIIRLFCFQKNIFISSHKKILTSSNLLPRSDLTSDELFFYKRILDKLRLFFSNYTDHNFSIDEKKETSVNSIASELNFIILKTLDHDICYSFLISNCDVRKEKYLSEITKNSFSSTSERKRLSNIAEDNQIYLLSTYKQKENIMVFSPAYDFHVSSFKNKDFIPKSLQITNLIDLNEAITNKTGLLAIKINVSKIKTTQSFDKELSKSKYDPEITKNISCIKIISKSYSEKRKYKNYSGNYINDAISGRISSKSKDEESASGFVSKYEKNRRFSLNEGGRKFSNIENYRDSSFLDEEDQKNEIKHHHWLSGVKDRVEQVSTGLPYGRVKDTSNVQSFVDKKEHKVYPKKSKIKSEIYGEDPSFEHDLSTEIHKQEDLQKGHQENENIKTNEFVIGSNRIRDKKELSKTSQYATKNSDQQVGGDKKLEDSSKKIMSYKSPKYKKNRRNSYESDITENYIKDDYLSHLSPETGIHYRDHKSEVQKSFPKEEIILSPRKGKGNDEPIVQKENKINFQIPSLKLEGNEINLNESSSNIHSLSRETTKDRLLKENIDKNRHSEGDSHILIEQSEIHNDPKFLQLHLDYENADNSEGSSYGSTANSLENSLTRTVINEGFEIDSKIHNLGDQVRKKLKTSKHQKILQENDPAILAALEIANSIDIPKTEDKSSGSIYNEIVNYLEECYKLKHTTTTYIPPEEHNIITSLHLNFKKPRSHLEDDSSKMNNSDDEVRYAIKKILESYNPRQLKPLITHMHNWKKHKINAGDLSPRYGLQPFSEGKLPSEIKNSSPQREDNLQLKLAISPLVEHPQILLIKNTQDTHSENEIKLSSQKILQSKSSESENTNLETDNPESKETISK